MNMTYIALTIILMLFEYYLGNTKDIKANSTLQLIFDILSAMKRNMKG